MSGGFSLGFLSRVYSPSADPKVYRDTLELFKVAEALGFDSGWVAQHHFASEHGRLPAPLVLLAAVAQRTRHISLGTGIIVLPQEPPLRLAEDAAVLDLLSNGRLELGLGAGFDPETFLAFGREHDARHRDYEQHLHQLLNALGNAPLTDSGSRLLPRANGLSHRLWEATSRVELVAERGHGLIMAPNPHQPADAGTDLVNRYRNAWTGDNGTPARVARVQALFPAPDDATRNDIRAYVQRQQRIGVFKGAINDDFDTTLKRLGVLHGPVQQMVEQLQQGPALTAHDQLILQVQTVSTPLRDAIRALEIIREHIAPALGWQPTGTPS
ncbi:LLM class flavin-dependent oxidoreductase [Pseudomonas aylmerensis]|uniref:LLM class flavin-dependent oxidoreductase n=1 Tax=Pseudomonas aylmerensis TaxID=1869229 RepID=A0A2T4G4R4_9PSED|nr:LLM class flavin-dependent oxidoreductase [Pseudomonas aylmerensis]OCW27617.1 monooxygenase [Pseudomonas aylmerensis]PTC30671.1 LLM class flavin-dependent oxidoreductase [Pseudomonas aylmerensis]